MSKRISVSAYSKAITESHGILAAAARRLGVSRVSVYRAVSKHPTLQAALDDARAEVLDLGESRLYEKVHEGNLSAVTFLLSTLGRDRGFVTRHEVEQPRMTPKELAELSDEALEARARELGIK